MACPQNGAMTPISVTRGVLFEAYWGFAKQSLRNCLVNEYTSPQRPDSWEAKHRKGTTSTTPRPRKWDFSSPSGLYQTVSKRNRASGKRGTVPQSRFGRTIVHGPRSPSPAPRQGYVRTMPGPRPCVPRTSAAGRPASCRRGPRPRRTELAIGTLLRSSPSRSSRSGRRTRYASCGGRRRPLP